MRKSTITTTNKVRSAWSRAWREGRGFLVHDDNDGPTHSDRATEDDLHEVFQMKTSLFLQHFQQQQAQIYCSPHNGSREATVDAAGQKNHVLLPRLLRGI